MWVTRQPLYFHVWGCTAIYKALSHLVFHVIITAIPTEVQ